MQAYFFPYIGYFNLISSVDTFVIYDNVTFRKKSWITRNRILDKGNAEPIYINLPVIGKSSVKLIKELSIDENVKWKYQFLKLIYFNYKKAPYFSDIYPVLERIISIKENNLHTFNALIIIELCDLLDIKTNIVYQNDMHDKVELELKNEGLYNNSNTKHHRIVKLCKKYHYDTYVNPIGGVDLYDKKLFKANDLNLLFVKTKPYTYKQFGETFTPHLSIIDMLMHTGLEATKKNVLEYELI